MQPRVNTRRSSVAAAALVAMMTLFLATPAAAATSPIFAELEGLQVVPGPGDPDGWGILDLSLDPITGEMCWEFWSGDAHVNHVTIHQGASGAVGAEVAFVSGPGPSGYMQGCRTIDTAVAQAIVDDPSSYYVQGRADAFPNGAIRDQLFRPYDVVRASGPDRYATAAAISGFQYPAEVPAVYVATGENFPDALAGGPAAGLDGGPVLLVTTELPIPSAIAAELDRLGPATIYVLGGPTVVSEAVQMALQAYTDTGTPGSVIRLSGVDRYATAAAISAARFPAELDTVLIATGENFPDALAGAAAGSFIGAPVLLATRDTIPPATAAELARLHPTRIFVLGGPSVVSEAVEAALSAYTKSPDPGMVQRLSGPDRYATAIAITQQFYAPGDWTGMYVATGLNFPDALAAAPVGAPLLLVPGNDVALRPDLASEVKRLNPGLIVLSGGPSVLSDEIGRELRVLPGRPS
jgi:putative cell wall-binding protein